MMRKIIVSLCCGMLLLSGIGCGTSYRMQQGAAAGAALGAVIGHDIGEDTESALIGAAVGGAAGAVIGDAIREHEREQYDGSTSSSQRTSPPRRY
ncbi:hypothetical protein CSB45_09900 [candidate division KSB3 bacterium]|uniref:YMGG-like Gly-zipper domain-containing protein n=1 Tax=candidate division KSB3 bacterium TaxID=2044937 RepID=A0A2G6E3U6_9BACT|nr:MAG: hypothetical protein CSB45_09900 [candidate division KSB3 bacterium]PIE29369.1 MAG: hypothetical protein CSA57_09190 [candidate division KSB3 bacterium]